MEVERCLFMEAVHSRHAVAGSVAEQHPVFDMDSANAARLQHAVQVAGQVIHLLPEMCVAFSMAEIVIGRRVFIMVGKWN